MRCRTKPGVPEWSRAIALLLNGQTLQVSNEDGEWIVDDSFLLLVNAAHEGVEFTLPASPSSRPWIQLSILRIWKTRLSSVFGRKSDSGWPVT